MLTDRFPEALAYAEGLHRAQKRKGNDIPYIAHLLAVTAIVLEWGGSEDVGIAALLHDAAEDQGGLETLGEIRRRFGERVADIVEHCSDSLTADKATKAPWRERKQAYIDRLADATADVALVSVADKLHNLQAQIRDVRKHGPETMARFNAGPDAILWYNRSIIEALARHRDFTPLGELADAADELARLLGVATPA